MNAPQKIALMLAAAAIALPQGANAKSLSKAWNGSWHLNMAKSKFSSAEFTPKSDNRSYTVAGDRLTMRSTGTLASGKPLKWSYSARANGKWYPTSGNPYADHVALTYVSPREFKSETKLKGKPFARSTVRVSADGKMLTVARSMLAAKGGPTDDTLVYERVK